MHRITIGWWLFVASVPTLWCSTRVPIAFEPNRGQAPRTAEFVARMAGGSVQLSASRAEFHGRTLRFAVTLEGPAQYATSEGEEALPGLVHYLGSVTDVPTYSRVRYRNVYRGVDIVYYSRGRFLEYDFEVAPGADPNRIRIRFDGVPAPRIDSSGDLVFAGGLKQHRPIIYQEIQGRRQIVPGRYLLHGSVVGIAVGPYDHRRSLVIDPVIAWATYFGGGNSDSGESVALDRSGNIYITGTTLSAFGDANVFVAKLAADGASTIFTAQFPGSGNDYGHSIAVDASGNTYLAGETSSTDFLADFTYVTRNAFGGVPHVFVSKLDPTGRSLIYSHLIAGAGAEIAYGIALDPGNNAYIAGATTSSDFPFTTGAAQTSRSGGADAFAMRFDTNGVRIYGTFLGGAGDDYAYGIAVDAAGSAFLTGTTSSGNFPASPGAWQSKSAGGFDAFLTKLSPTATLLFSSYLGGSGNDFSYAIAVDADGGAYITGETTSTDFPSIGAYQPNFAGGSGDIFVTRFAPDAASLIYSTYLGGTGEDFASGIALDPAANAYIIGTTTSTDFPVRDAFQPASAGGVTNAVIAGFDSSGGSLLFASYLGGSGNAGTAAEIGDSGSSIAMSCTAGLVALGSTASTDFPATAGVVGSAFVGGITDAFVAKLGIGAVPVVAEGGVVNSATFAAGNVAPGSLVSIFGSALVWGAQSLAVTVNGAPAPVLAATAGQINIQLPYDVAPGSARLSIASPCGPSNELTFTVASVAPYLFLSPSGEASAASAAPGSPVTVNLIGIGPVDAPVPAGTPTPADPVSKATLPASATIGGVDAVIQFLGLKPAAVGVGQAIVTVPATLAPGSYPLILTVAGVPSNAGSITVVQPAVQPAVQR